MSIATSENDVATLSLLEQACSINLSAEIHYDRDETLCTARCRLLWINDEELRTDSPQCIGKQVALVPDEEVTVYFVLDDKHYSFRTNVIKAVMGVDLNAETHVVGMSIHIPDEIREQQRRQNFRVALSAYDIRVDAHEAHAEVPECAATECVRFSGRLINISTGGLGLLVEARPGLKFKMWAPLYLEFCLPDEPTPLILLVEIKHIRTFPERDRFVFGLQFVPIDGVDTRMPFRSIRTFATAEQRRQMQNRR